MPVAQVATVWGPAFSTRGGVVGTLGEAWGVIHRGHSDRERLAAARVVAAIGRAAVVHGTGPRWSRIHWHWRQGCRSWYLPFESTAGPAEKTDSACCCS